MLSETSPSDPGAHDLDARLARAEAEISALRAELLQSRAASKALAESIPDAVSRRAVVRSIIADLTHPGRWLAARRRSRRGG